MVDTLLLRPSPHFTTLHPTTIHSTSLHFLSLHFFLFKLHPTTVHYPLIWLKTRQISYHSISPHITTLHFNSLLWTFRCFSPQFYSFHFTPFIIDFLNLFLKILGLQRKASNASSGNFEIGCATTKTDTAERSITIGRESLQVFLSLPLLTCSPSAWPSRLLYRRGRKTRRVLWITLYCTVVSK